MELRELFNDLKKKLGYTTKYFDQGALEDYFDENYCLKDCRLNIDGDILIKQTLTVEDKQIIFIICQEYDDLLNKSHKVSINFDPKHREYMNNYIKKNLLNNLK